MAPLNPAHGIVVILVAPPVGFAMPSAAPGGIGNPDVPTGAEPPAPPDALPPGVPAVPPTPRPPAAEPPPPVLTPPLPPPLLPPPPPEADEPPDELAPPDDVTPPDPVAPPEADPDEPPELAPPEAVCPPEAVVPPDAVVPPELVPPVPLAPPELDDPPEPEPGAPPVPLSPDDPQPITRNTRGHRDRLLLSCKGASRNAGGGGAIRRVDGGSPVSIPVFPWPPAQISTLPKFFLPRGDAMTQQTRALAGARYSGACRCRARPGRGSCASLC